MVICLHIVFLFCIIHQLFRYQSHLAWHAAIAHTKKNFINFQNTSEAFHCATARELKLPFFPTSNIKYSARHTIYENKTKKKSKQMNSLEEESMMN